MNPDLHKEIYELRSELGIEKLTPDQSKKVLNMLVTFIIVYTDGDENERERLKNVLKSFILEATSY
ncbi:hypothetical protein MKY91_20490 [Alkalicoccobacillus gibsonii]|uniref:Uncharacterized protein n=1 Tax=Alkalicoccobacillus gibsonii TaxID=79881 RepID=A0ABU9VNS2_9BACI